VTSLTYESLLSWPGALRPDRDRVQAPFAAGWKRTLTDLDREATHLGAERVIIRLAYPPHAIRLDGSLRGDYARRPPSHPGVVVVLDTHEHGALTYSTDTFTEWRQNVRAVALGLDALRRVERYGIADEGQQYAGFRAIGTGVALGRPAPVTLQEAAALLGDALGDGPVLVLRDAGIARTAYRAAVKLLHPDHGGSGDGERMARLAEAWALVSAHHGG
jgi:hypothetical protein